MDPKSISPPPGTPPSLEPLLVLLERIARALEHIAMPGSRSALSDEPDASRVAYLDDAEQVEREDRQRAYWLQTGRKLDPWEMPPRPVDEKGLEWGRKDG